MKKTKAAKIMKMLEAGESVSYIKRMLAVSESYIYSVKKQMEGAMETVKETILSMDTDLSFVKPGEFIQADTNVDAILDERANTYGSFEDVANVAQEFKNIAYDSLKARQRTIYADQAEALDMIFSKIARIVIGDPNHTDSWIDIAGYAKLVADRLEGKVR
jgi:hypothetical protein